MKKTAIIASLICLCICLGLAACGEAGYVHDGTNDPGPPHALSFSSLEEYAAYANTEPGRHPDGDMDDDEETIAARQAMEAAPFPIIPDAGLTNFRITWRNELESLWVRYETPAGAVITFTIPMDAAGQEQLADQPRRGKELPAQHLEELYFSSKYKTTDNSPVYVYTAQVEDVYIVIRAFSATKDDAAQILAEVEFSHLPDLCQIAEPRPALDAEETRKMPGGGR